MSVNTSVTSALVGLVVVMLVAGLVMGLAFTGTDLLNPRTSEARANEMNQATEYQAQMDAIDLEHHQWELEAQAAAQEEQLHQETEFQGQRQEQELAHQRKRDALRLTLLQIREGVLLGAGVLALLSVGGGLTFYLVSLGRRAQRLQRDPWQSPEWRENMRRLAQANERLLRHLESSRRSPDKEVAGGGNGRHREPVWSEN